MDHHNFSRRRRGHSYMVHMYVPVRVVMVVPYVRIVMMVMGDVMSYVGSMGSMVGLVVLYVGTSLQI